MGLPALIPILGPILDKALAFIPDPEAKAKAKMELAKELSKQEDAFRDFVVAYEGRGDQVHWGLQLYRGSVRPTLTYALAGTFIYGFVNPVAFNTEVMTMLFQLNLLSMSFWFGERALKGLGLNIAKMVGKDAG